MRANEKLLVELAGAVLDRRPVDWDAAELDADAALRPAIDELKLLAAVTALHRSPPPAHAPLLNAGSSPNLSGEHVDGKGEEPPVRWGHLEVREKIGQGAFGEVFRARDPTLDRDVALKLLPAGSEASEPRATSIIEEGRLLARVRHPNVVTIHGAEHIGDRIGLWMELVKGRTLQQILDEGNPFTAEATVEVGLQLCDAVSAVHAAGMLHRDIKAHNVMRADDGRVVLMDFGTGGERGESAGDSIAGTPLYLAPELLAGEAPSVSSDVYSLGVLLYHLLTGSYPVRADDVQRLRLAHERNERAGLRSGRPDAPAALARIIDRAVDPDPLRRYPDVASMRDNLAVLSGRGERPLARIAVVSAAALLVFVSILWVTRYGPTAGPAVGSTMPGSPESGAVGPAEGDMPIDVPVIAVLPFDGLADDSGRGFLAAEIPAEIIRDLAHVEGMHVISERSSFTVGARPELREVGELLGANLVVTGSLVTSGETLRVAFELVRVADGVVLANGTLDRPIRSMSDGLSIVDEVARRIVERLELTLGERQRRYDIDIPGWGLYARARALVDERGVANGREAERLFLRVIEQDDRFAPAWAGLSSAYAHMSETLEPGALRWDEALPLMRARAERALDLDAELAEGYAAMGFVFARTGQWEDARRSFRHAIDLDPSLTQNYTDYSISTLVPMASLDEAEEILKAALRADSESSAVRREMAIVQINAGRYDEAIANLEWVLERDPRFTYADHHLARALALSGKVEDAVAIWDTMEPRQRLWGAHALVLAGRGDEVVALAAMETQPYRLAVLYAALGDTQRALDELERAADLMSPDRIGKLMRHPEVALRLGNDPRFEAVLRKLGLA